MTEPFALMSPEELFSLAVIFGITGAAIVVILRDAANDNQDDQPNQQEKHDDPQ